MRHPGICITFAVMLSAVLVAQPRQQPQVNTFHNEPTPPPLPVPDVHTDGTVTFTIRAPKASAVALLFGDPTGSKPQPMEKSTDGVWRITIGPVDPEIYQYRFIVDGVQTVDVLNPWLATTAGFKASLVEVPGIPPRFDEIQDVSHGAIHIRTYASTVQKRTRGLYVYVPPDYGSIVVRRYPVLYLRHGASADESSWSQVGRSGATRPGCDPIRPFS